jgi:hypothetical protein
MLGNYGVSKQLGIFRVVLISIDLVTYIICIICYIYYIVVAFHGNLPQVTQIANEVTSYGVLNIIHYPVFK